MVTRFKLSLKKHQASFLLLFLFLILMILIYTSYDLFMKDKFYPFTFAGDIHISFLNVGQATNILSQKIQNRSSKNLEFHYQGRLFSINLATASASLNYSILEQELRKNHPSFLPERFVLQFQSLTDKNFIEPQVNIKIDSQVDSIASSIFTPPKNAELVFDETKTLEGSPSANIQIKEGADGVELDKDRLEREVKGYILTGRYNTNLPVKKVGLKITSEYVKKLKNILENSLKSPVKLQFEAKEYTLDTKQLLAILDLENGTDSILDKEKTYSFLEKIAQEIDTEVIEGKFVFDSQNKRVTEFKPSSSGKKLDIDKTYILLVETLNAYSTGTTIILPVTTTLPKIKTSDVNNLGITELLGQGVSHFAGSIANRIYNLSLASSRMNGVLIAPGETFSFNDSVGDISGSSGYKPAYVIKSGRTVLDDGGGVCQVSTTIFRAALNAGLPIVQRVSHAYRVGYYEQGFPPGLDATVFAPSVDFKFKNDTNYHILIQAYVSGNSLYVGIYGTPDGRFVDMIKPTVTNITPPPPDLRQDDPTLSKGEIKQVDWPAYGATVSFNRTVKRGKEVLSQETFRSNYKAWQAIYLVGTKEN